MDQKLKEPKYRTTAVFPENLGRALEVYIVYNKLKNIPQNKSQIIQKGLEHILSSDNNFMRFLEEVKEYKPLYEFLRIIKNAKKI